MCVPRVTQVLRPLQVSAERAERPGFVLRCLRQRSAAARLRRRIGWPGLLPAELMQQLEVIVGTWMLTFKDTVTIVEDVCWGTWIRRAPLGIAYKLGWKGKDMNGDRGRELWSTGRLESNKPQNNLLLIQPLSVHPSPRLASTLDSESVPRRSESLSTNLPSRALRSPRLRRKTNCVFGDPV
jgi:hypothetical protein